MGYCVLLGAVVCMLVLTGASRFGITCTLVWGFGDVRSYGCG